MGGEAEMGIRLALSTSDGAASDWIRMYWAEKKAQRVDLDWNDFKTTLQTRFGEADSDTAALDHLTRMTRAAKEPVAMFGERVHVAAREAFGAEGIANPVAQSVALLTFMRGCKSPSLVRSLCRNKPATLLEAVNRAGEEAVLQHQINTMINGPETDKDHQGFEAMDVDLIHRDEEQSENDTQETETSQRSGTSGDSSNTMLSSGGPSTHYQNFPLNSYGFPPPPPPTYPYYPAWPTYPPHPYAGYLPYEANMEPIGEMEEGVDEIYENSDEIFVDEDGFEIHEIGATHPSRGTSGRGRGRGRGGQSSSDRGRKVYRVPRSWVDRQDTPPSGWGGRGGTRGRGISQRPLGPPSFWQMRQMSTPENFAQWASPPTNANPPKNDFGPPLQFTPDGKPICGRCRQVGHIRKECPLRNQTNQ